MRLKLPDLTKASFTIVLMLAFAQLLGQKISAKMEFPEFIGPENSFEKYFNKEFFTFNKRVSRICDTSIGMIEFYVSKNGKAEFITIPPTFPEEIGKIIFRIVNASNWIPMKVDGKIVESLPIVLTIFISIDVGCNENDVKGLGVGGDFERMLSTFRNESFRNCILLKPITYTLPSNSDDSLSEKNGSFKN